MQKRMLSLAISLLMVFALIPMGAVTVMAQDEQVTTVTKDTHTMETGTYRVTNNVTITPNKKGLVKGKTYTLKYKVRIKATRNYKATKFVTRTVKIKIR